MSLSLRRPGSVAVAPGRRASRLVRLVKNTLVTPGPRPRTILGGVLKGVRMHLDLAHQTQVYLGTYEREVQGWLRSLGRDAVTALDVGAADGTYALYFLMRTPARTVFAFEPDSEARGRLLANLRLNGLDTDARVRVAERAVGEGDDAERVTLDSLYADIQLPGVVKVDVEGRELEVLRGADRLLRRGGLAWIIETHSLDIERRCIGLLESYGLTVRVVSHSWWRFVLPEMRPMAHNRWLVASDARPQLT